MSVAFLQLTFYFAYIVLVKIMLIEISNIIWVITAFLILYVGIYYTIFLRFPQFNFISIIKSLKKNNNKKSNTFELLFLTLAGKIGVGSISGIALCILYGGLGSLFWLWISAILLASLSFVETKLGIKYKETYNGESIGGPSFYIEKGLNMTKLAKFYSVLIIITYIFSFISIQSNTIIISLENIINVNKLLLVLMLIVLTFFSIFRGIKTITRITNYLVPIMGIFYIIIGMIIILNNLSSVIEIFKQIFISAFNIKALKASILIPIIVGIERGIFSNEAGMGTTAMIAGLSNDNDIEKQANVQIIGTFFTSLIICTITALIILTSNYQNLSVANINGIELVSYAFFEHFGYFGIIMLTIIIFLFAFSTIVTSYYYGEINIKYLTKSNKYINLLKIIVIIIIIYSAFTNPQKLWLIVDIIVALISLINVYAMYKLRKKL